MLTNNSANFDLIEQLNKEFEHISYELQLDKPFVLKFQPLIPVTCES